MRTAWIFTALTVGLATAPSMAMAANSASTITTIRFSDASAALAPGSLATTDSAFPDTVPSPPPPFVREINICSSRTGCTTPGPICQGDSILVKLAGVLPSDCYYVRRIDLIPAPNASPGISPPWVRLIVDNGCCLGRPCSTVEQPFEAYIKLPPLPAGFYPLTIQVPEVCCTDSVVDPGPAYTNYGFAVQDSCDSLPPKPLPYVDNIQVVGPRVCITTPCPTCPGDSLYALISGTLPPCYQLRRIDVLPSIETVIGPPTLRIVVDNACCALQRCIPSPPTPWHARVALPPLPSGRYFLRTMLAEVCCTDSVPPGRLPTTFTHFEVDSCDVPPFACLMGRWLHPERYPCDSQIAPGQPATVTFAIQTNVALAGLQGEFNLGYIGIPEDQRPGPIVTRIEAIGLAAGMHLRWNATPSGAKFVMFSDTGAPIPPSDLYGTDILDVTVQLQPGGKTPAEIIVHATNLLGSDAAGHGIERCPVRVADDVARICITQGCDFNRDNFTDVRDLVLMVQCLHSDTCFIAEPHRDPPSPPRLDCDQNGQFNLDDVLCCAGRILRIPPCPGCPVDTTAIRKEPRVLFSLEPATETDLGAEVPIRLEGAEHVGAARLALRFPSDRYVVDAVDASSAGSNWLTLHQVTGNEIVIGLIQVGGTDGAASAAEGGPKRINIRVRLRLNPGMKGGGELAATATDFSGTDGARLEINVNAPTQPLAGGLGFALSENRPEPFSGVTRFSLTMPEPGLVDLGVYDIGGRRVASIHRGMLGAGITEFTWNGSTGAGRARAGIYFYRATVAGRTLSRKTVLLKNE